jgi:AhpD family alkylhydroperoxidase
MQSSNRSVNGSDSYRTSIVLMAVSPDVLSGFIALQTALDRTLDARTRDTVALTVSQANGCNYCLGAHSYVAAKFNGTDAEEIALAREASPPIPVIARRGRSLVV